MGMDAPQRRAATQRPVVDVPEDSGKNRWFPVWLVLVLLVGVGIGVFFMKNRYAKLEKEVVVSINGVNITKDEFYRQLERSAGNPNLSNGEAVLRSMVLDEVYLQFANSRGVAPTKDQISAAYRRLKKTPDFDKRMENLGLRPRDVRRNLSVAMAQTAVIVKGVTATEAEARKFYEQNIDPQNRNARFFKPQTTSIQAIVTKTEADGKAAVAELRNGGKWSDVAKKYSLDPRRGAPVDIPRGRSLAARIPGAEDIIFGVKIGKMTGPVKIANTWWIITCGAQTLAETRPYEDVKEDCMDGARLQKVAPAETRKMKQEFKVFLEKTTQKPAMQVFWKQYTHLKFSTD